MTTLAQKALSAARAASKFTTSETVTAEELKHTIVQSGRRVGRTHLKDMMRNQLTDDQVADLLSNLKPETKPVNFAQEARNRFEPKSWSK